MVKYKNGRSEIFGEEVSKMHNQNIGLVIEGGGMRGAYTAGVLDVFMEEEIKFPYVIGVSAGANNGSSYISCQKGRNKRIFSDWVKDERFLGFKNILKERSYFGMEFLFDILPNELDPFDYETFKNSEVLFKVCVTHCETGEPVYFEHKDYDTYDFINKVLRASSSLPLISPIVEIEGEKYLDGGMVDPIPIEKSISDGNEYNVIILTRNDDYRKSASKLDFLADVFFRNYPKLAQKLMDRHNQYNNCVDKIKKLEEEGYVYVFRPKKRLAIDRLEKDVSKLSDLYTQGYDETINQMSEFNEWIQKVKEKSFATNI